MSVRIDSAEIRDTVEINIEDLRASKEDVNDLIVSDLLVNIGYNRKKDKNVKKLTDSELDWHIENESGTIGVKIYALDDEQYETEKAEIEKYCLSENIDILLVIQGDKLSVYRCQKDKNSVQEVEGAVQVDLKEDLSESALSIIEAISKEGFDLSKIDDIVNVLELTSEELAEIIKESSEEIVKLVNTFKNTDGYTSEIVGRALVELLGGKADKGENMETPDLASESKAESLQTEIDSLQKEAETLRITISEKDKEVETLKEQAEALKNEAEELKNQLEAQAESSGTEEPASAEIKSLQEELETAQNSAKSLESDLETANGSIEALRFSLDMEKENAKASNEKIENLQEKLQVISAENEEMHEKLESTDNSELERVKAELQSLTESNELLEETIKKNTETINNLEAENESLKANSNASSASRKNSNTEGNNSDAAGLSKEIESRYIEKIRDLSLKLSDAEEERDASKAELEELRKQVNELSGSERKAAEQLLNVIEDSPNGQRMYVGVINKELIQYPEIHTFVGRALQALYNIEGLAVQQFIFAGDMYTLNNNSKYRDLMLGSSSYDIEFKSNSEINELNNLRIIFSHFSNVIFLCKTVGVSSDVIKDRETIKEDNRVQFAIDNDQYIDESESDLGDGQNLSDNSDDAGDANFNEAAFSNGFGEGEQVDNSYSEGFGEFTGEAGETGETGETGEEGNWSDGLTENPGNRVECLVGCQISAIDDMIWTDDTIDFTAIKYIGTDSQCEELPSATFNISGNSLDMVVCKCIDSLLAVASYVGDSNLIPRLKQKDFSEVNMVFKLYTDEYKGYPKVNGTKYAIAGIQSVRQAATVIKDVYEALQISVQNLFLWMVAEADEESWIREYEIPEDAIALSENIAYEKPEDFEDEIGICIVKGDFPNSMVITKNSLRVHKEILVKPLAIKTKYMQKVIGSDADIKETITNMLTVASNNGRSVDYSMFGNLLGTGKKLLSVNAGDVGENPYELDMIGEKVYCARMEEWQVTHSLIRIHTTLFNDTAIAIKNNVNLSALDFYAHGEFKTVEPSLAFAVRSFTRYIESCVKRV